MREIRLSGSEGGGTGNSTGPPYPYPQVPAISVGTGGDGVTQAREYAENAGFFGRSGPCPRNPSPDRRCASRAACPRRSGGPITLPPGGHGAPGDHHGRSGSGKCSQVFRKTGKKSGMVLFFSMIPVGCAVPPRAGQRTRGSGRPLHPCPNLPKEREIFSSADQPGPTGVPDFGKTENRNHGRWRDRAGGVVVGAGLRGGVRLVQHAGKNSSLRKGAGTPAAGGLLGIFGVNLA